MKGHKDVYTTGQIAKLLKVSVRVVGKWIDGGVLAGYRLPNPLALGDKGMKGAERRVRRQDLLDFMVRNSIPLSYLDGDPEKKLLWLGESPFASLAASLCPAKVVFEVCLFKAGHLLTTGDYAAAVLDYSCAGLSNCDLDRARASLAAVFAKVRRLALFPEGGSPDALGFHKAWQKPLDPAYLAESIGRELACGGPDSGRPTVARPNLSVVAERTTA